MPAHDADPKIQKMYVRGHVSVIFVAFERIRGFQEALSPKIDLDIAGANHGKIRTWSLRGFGRSMFPTM